MQSYRFDTPLHADGYQFGFRGLGVLGATVPEDGRDGPAFGFPSIEPADLQEEVQFEVLTDPGGDFFANEDSSFSYSGPSTKFTFRKKGPTGTSTATAFIKIGDGSSATISMVSVQRIVVFEGSGPRLEIGSMTAKPAYKVGDKWMSDRDPDEKSRYAADITDELSDRMTTAQADGVEILTSGVTLLEDLVFEVAVINGMQRTFVIAFLGPAEGSIPADWGWTARVNCANGERFDHTTYFVKKPT